MSGGDDGPDPAPVKESAAEQTTARSWLTPDQVKQIRSACLTEAFPTYLQQRNYTIVTVLADAGLRVSELVALDVDDLRLDAAEPHIHLPSAKQKGRPGDASIPLDRGSGVYGAVDQLRTYLADPWPERNHDGALFPSRQNPRMSERAVQNMVKRAARAADVAPQMKSTALDDGEEPGPEHVTPHTFRHSVAYRIIVTEGGRLEDVQMHLRHASRETTDRIYSHLRAIAGA